MKAQIPSAVVDEIERLPGFNTELVAAVTAEDAQWGSGHATRVAAAMCEVAKLQSESDKLSAAIRLGDPPQRLVNDMRKNELELAEALRRHRHPRYRFRRVETGGENTPA